ALSQYDNLTSLTLTKSEAILLEMIAVKKHISSEPQARIDRIKSMFFRSHATRSIEVIYLGRLSEPADAVGLLSTVPYSRRCRVFTLCKSVLSL
ncbi:MAG: hypothetical protein ACI4EX_00195, partial [Lachnospiraceae bacterium]